MRRSGIEAERPKLNVVADSVKMDIPFFQHRLARQQAILGQAGGQSDELPARLSRSDQDYENGKRVLIKALGQFTRVQNLKAVQEGYDYFVKQLWSRCRIRPS